MSHLKAVSNLTIALLRGRPCPTGDWDLPGGVAGEARALCARTGGLAGSRRAEAELQQELELEETALQQSMETLKLGTLRDVFDGYGLVVFGGSADTAEGASA